MAKLTILVVFFTILAELLTNEALVAWEKVNESMKENIIRLGAPFCKSVVKFSEKATTMNALHLTSALHTFGRRTNLSIKSRGAISVQPSAVSRRVGSTRTRRSQDKQSDTKCLKERCTSTKRPHSQTAIEDLLVPPAKKAGVDRMISTTKCVKKTKALSKKV